MSLVTPSFPGLVLELVLCFTGSAGSMFRYVVVVEASMLGSVVEPLSELGCLENGIGVKDRGAKKEGYDDVESNITGNLLETATHRGE